LLALVAATGGHPRSIEYLLKQRKIFKNPEKYVLQEIFYNIKTHVTKRILLQPQNIIELITKLCLSGIPVDEKFLGAHDLVNLHENYNVVLAKVDQSYQLKLPFFILYTMLTGDQVHLMKLSETDWFSLVGDNISGLKFEHLDCIFEQVYLEILNITRLKKKQLKFNPTTEVLMVLKKLWKPNFIFLPKVNIMNQCISFATLLKTMK